MKDVIVIGAGVIGAFIARNLSRYNLDVLIIDKENDVGNETSNANSAIIHSGYDPKPNTNKAKFNVLGNKMIEQICNELDVHLGKIGSLTLAFNEEEEKELQNLKIRADINGVNAYIIDKEEILKMENNINDNVRKALYAPNTYIVDTFNLCAHAIENALDNGVNLVLNEEVISIKEMNNYFIIKTNKNIYESKIVINAAGLGSEKIARMIEDVSWHIIPRKGQYYVLDHFSPTFLNHILFPMPSKVGKGVLLTPTTSMNYLIGPSNEICDIDDNSTDDLALEDIKQKASRMVKNIPFNETVRVFAGIRATNSTGDFIIEHSKCNENFINVAGIDSPGLASSTAIGEYVVKEMVAKLIILKEKDNYNPYIRKYIEMRALNNEMKNEMIKRDEDFGEIICLCEKITLGEIKDLFTRSLKPTSVKAIKKRCRAGFGKCQSGFCQSKILKIISSSLSIPLNEVNYDKENSSILLKRLKEEKNDL